MHPSTDDVMVLADDVRKAYGETQALDGLNLSVPAGTVCGVLGPNGAGKTTAVRVLTTLTRADSGVVRVAGYDVTKQPQEVRFKIGLAGQHAAVDESLTGRENLVMFGKLYHLGARAARKRADELLERFDLAKAGGRIAKEYSGGMLRRLHLLSSLIVAPPVLFLDEPTTGLDPRSRNEIWATVRELVTEGATVVLTTQYLDEADQLADDIAVVDSGRVIASGTPDELKSTLGTRVDVTVGDAAELPAARAALSGLWAAEPVASPQERLLSIAVTGSGLTLPSVVRLLDSAGVTALDVALRRPTLDEVFLTLTGKAAPAATESENDLVGSAAS